jgi:hypothetical protein
MSWKNCRPTWLPSERSVLALRVASSNLKSVGAASVRLLVSQQSKDGGVGAGLVAEENLSAQDSDSISDSGSVDIVERETILGVEPVVLDVEPVILLLIGENGTELFIKRGS